MPSIGSDGARVVVLARTWGTRDEPGWALRQVAGALACTAEVHVVTLEGAKPAERADGAFSVHELASAPEKFLEARRDVIVEAVTRSLPPGSSVSSDHDALAALNRLLGGELSSCWEPAAEVLRELSPDFVVVADYRQVGAIRAVDKACPGVPVMVAPQVTDAKAVGCSAFSALFDRATSAFVFTESEKRAIKAVYEGLVAHHVGLPLSANRSVLREPNDFLKDLDYVLVISPVPAQARERSAAFTRLLRARFTRRPIAVVAPNSFTVSLNGSEDRFEAVERGSDVLRLIAWARATVDLRPGRLFARRSLESLLYATPIVVPSESRAREHAELGGGLWFEGPTDLMYCVETLFDRDVSESLGARGNAYAMGMYGSTNRFLDNVLSVTGLEALPKPIR